jgi:hypothetical protein
MSGTAPYKYLQFSPAEELHAVSEQMQKNMAAMQRIEQVSASGRTPMGAGPAPHLRAVRRPGAVTQDCASSRRTPS